MTITRLRIEAMGDGLAVTSDPNGEWVRAENLKPSGWIEFDEARPPERKRVLARIEPLQSYGAPLVVVGFMVGRSFVIPGLGERRQLLDWSDCLGDVEPW